MKQVLKVAALLLGALVVLGAGALAADRLLLSDDDEPAAPALGVKVLATGTFQASHAYAPYYVVPRTRFADPSKLSRVASDRIVTRPESALSKGGQAASPQVVRLELLATGDERVVVESIAATVVSDARPLVGWFVAAPGCEFERVPLARVSFDDRRPRVRYAGADGKRRPTPGLTVDGVTPQVVELHAFTTRRRVAWTAELTLRAEGADATQTVVVDDDGEPFRVTSARSSRGYGPLYGATGIAGFERRGEWDDGIGGC